MKSLIKEIKDNNGLITMIDGLEYFWTQSVNRKLSSSQLRALADELDMLNGDWEKESYVFDEATKKRFDCKWELDEETGCHVWTANINDNGYGMFKCNGYKRAHRVAWEMKNGKIPTGMLVCHKCNNRSCVNPEHLDIGTHNENMQDMIDSGRSPRGTKNINSKYTEDQIIAVFKDTRDNKAISEAYNININYIYEIKRGKRWGWLTKDLKVGNS